MAINLFCPICKKTSKPGTTLCKCGHNLKRNYQYRVRVRMINGRWKSRVVDTFELAQAVEGQYKVDKIKENDLEIFETPAIHTVWKRYIQWAKDNKRSWRDDETRWKKHVVGHLGTMTMNKLRPKHIQDIVDKMRGSQWQPVKSKKKPEQPPRPYAPATIKQVVILIKRVFNWAIKNDLHHGPNPANKIQVPKFDNQVTNPFNHADLKTLLDYLETWENERAASVVKFGLYSGRRRGEILNLKWKDVDLESGIVTFPGMHTKGAKTQALPVNQSCLDILKRCHELKTSEYVFPGATGGFYTSFENVWKRLKKRLALPYRFHDLRHTFASYLASSGKCDIYTLKELLGHAEISMTMRYAHLVNGALKRAASIADDVFKDLEKSEIPENN